MRCLQRVVEWPTFGSRDDFFSVNFLDVLDPIMTGEMLQKGV